MSSMISILDSYLQSKGTVVLFSIYAAIIILMALIAWKKKWLKLSGIAGAVVSGAIILYFSGLSGFLLLLFFFLAGSMLSKALKRDIRSEKKGSERDISQVMANSLPAIAALFIGYFTPYKEAALIAYASALAEALADTWAGDFGMLSDKDPLSIVTMTRVPKGISGGVTAMGFAGAMSASLLMALLYVGTFTLSIEALLIISGAGFLGSVLDSFLGATIQVHYRDKNGCLTEHSESDGEKNERARGIPLIDNDAVNLLSGLFSMTLALLISMVVIH